MITSVGANNAVNNSFDDKSTSNHTILAVGNATQTTFSPYRHGGHSMYFGGAEAIGVGVGSYALDWSNGQTWTIEFWMKRQGANPDGHLFMKYPGSGSNISGIRAYVSGSEGRIGLHYNSGTELTTAGTRANIADGDWHHVAVTRGSGYFKIWVDGQLDATVSNSDADGMASSSSWAIGRHGSGTASAYLKDTLIRDFRIVGSEVYTSNFTAPTETLTAISGTQVLIANNLPYLKDSSSNGYTLTYYGNPSIEGAGPFDKPEYTAATHLGSARFDGTGDYLMAPSGTISSQNNSADFNFSSGAWTWEAWGYNQSPTSPASPHWFTARYNGTHRSSLYYNSAGSAITYWSNGSARIIGPALPANQWYHVALSSNGTTTTLWVNGVSQGTTTHMQSNYDMTMYVGAAAGASLETAGYWNGNIADARVVKAFKASLKARAKIVGHAAFAAEPGWFTTAPVYASQKLLELIGWNKNQVDLWEVNEAFAVVALAFMKELGISSEKVNVRGGACALGHPIGASGARIIVTLINALEQCDMKRGIATICLGGGEALAIAVERP